MTWTESASLHINDKDASDFVSSTMNVVLKLFTAICFGIIGFMPFVFPIMINEKFSDSYYQIPILMLATLFNVMVGLLSVIYIAKKNTKAVAKTSIMAAIINLIVNLGLIKFIGLYAASISTLVSYFAMAIYRYVDVQKYVKIKIDKKFLIVAFIMMPILLISYYINNLYLNIVMVLIVCLYALITNLKTLNIVLDFIKKKLHLNKLKENA